MTIRELIDAIAQEASLIAQGAVNVKELIFWETSWLDANVGLVLVATAFYVSYGYVKWQNYEANDDLTIFAIMQLFFTGIIYAGYQLITMML